MIDKEKLNDALRKMKKCGLKRQYRDKWTPECPTTGRCYHVAEVIYHYCAPKGYKPHFVKTGAKETHWYLMDEKGNVIDPTSDQFDVTPDYGSGRANGFVPVPGEKMSEAARKLAELLGLPKL